LSKNGRIPTSGDFLFPRPFRFGKSFYFIKVVGVTGFEPVTLRLSSACSNQLSYTPIKPNLACRAGARAKAGGAEGIRTPDLQLAKLPLYQLSYSPTFSAIYELVFANPAVVSE
jgi:hypothetical protein